MTFSLELFKSFKNFEQLILKMKQIFFLEISPKLLQNLIF